MKILHNEKEFLLPDSPKSMASFHAKIESENGGDKYKLSIHDCKSSIMLWGELNSATDANEAIDKLNNLINGIESLKNKIYDLYM